MYKTSDEENVTKILTKDEIEIFVLQNPKKFGDILKNGKLDVSRLSRRLKDNSPVFFRISNIKFDSAGHVKDYRYFHTYFRKCEGCNRIFSTEDPRNIYHSRNCQIQSHYNRDGKDRRCEVCGKSLRNKNRNAKTCSDACRMAIYRSSTRR